MVSFNRPKIAPFISYTLYNMKKNNQDKRGFEPSSAK
jgi:hypothetical protein